MSATSATRRPAVRRRRNRPYSTTSGLSATQRSKSARSLTVWAKNVVVSSSSSAVMSRHWRAASKWERCAWPRSRPGCRVVEAGRPRVSGPAPANARRRGRARSRSDATRASRDWVARLVEVGRQQREVPTILPPYPPIHAEHVEVHHIRPIPSSVRNEYVGRSHIRSASAGCTTWSGATSSAASWRCSRSSTDSVCSRSPAVPPRHRGRQLDPAADPSTAAVLDSADDLEVGEGDLRDARRRPRTHLDAGRPGLGALGEAELEGQRGASDDRDHRGQHPRSRARMWRRSDPEASSSPAIGAPMATQHGDDRLDRCRVPVAAHVPVAVSTPGRAARANSSATSSSWFIGRGSSGLATARGSAASRPRPAAGSAPSRGGGPGRSAPRRAPCRARTGEQRVGVGRIGGHEGDRRPPRGRQR